MMQEAASRRPPSLAGATHLSGAVHRGVRVPDSVLTAFLAAERIGTLPALLQERARLTRRIARRLLAPLVRVAGDALPPVALAAEAWQVLLRAVLAELRPDGRLGLDEIDASCWQQTGTEWRTLLALACHQGLVPVPAMPGVYRARPQDAPADQLCGLWDVAPSTVYRSIERGRRALLHALARPLGEGHALMRRQRALQHEVYRLLDLHEPDARVAWHRRQAAQALASQQGEAAAWHLLQAGDAAGFIDSLQRHAVALARCPDTDLLVREAAQWPLEDDAQVRLALAEAALWRMRGDAEGECRACEQALRLAHAARDPLLLGRAFGALGRYHEVRDPARAFACLQDSVDYLREAGLHEPSTVFDAALLDEFANTLVRLAWWYLLHNDPRAAPLLERARPCRTAPRARSKPRHCSRRPGASTGGAMASSAGPWNASTARCTCTSGSTTSPACSRPTATSR